MTNKKKAIILLSLILIFSSTNVFSKEDKDLISIVYFKNKITALISGKNPVSLKLRSDEKVKWKDARGNLGIFLTDKRVIAITPQLSSFEELPLRLGESEQSQPVISNFISIIATNEQGIAFSSKRNKFIQEPFYSNEKLLTTACSEKTGLIVTDKRGLAISNDLKAFKEIKLRLNEEIQETGVKADKAFIVTNKRIISFDYKLREWKVEKS